MFTMEMDVEMKVFHFCDPKFGMLLDEIKEKKAGNIQRCRKQQKPKNCSCRLCKCYLIGVRLSCRHLQRLITKRTQVFQIALFLKKNIIHLCICFFTDCNENSKIFNIP